MTPQPGEQLDIPDSVESVNDSTKLPEKRVRTRRVLSRVLLVMAVALGLYAIWPWLLPAFIYEGPMVQLAGDRQAALVWYMTRPAGDGLAVRVGADGREFPVETDGRRCVARLTDLTPNTDTPYVITYGDRVLTENTLGALRTADQPFSFAVFGDSGKATAEQYLLAERIAAAEPDFLVHTGDLIYGRGERRLYRDRFFTPYKRMLSRVSFWPSVGNHDVYEPVDESPYFGVFELPENGPAGVTTGHNYWFDYAGARFAVVDSEHDEETLRERVAPWLRQVMTAADRQWRFVVFHRPPYTAGKHSPCERIQRALVPVFEEVGVDIVFNGHDHMYQRTRPIRQEQVAEGGVVYIISGAGGARLYETLAPAERADYFASVHNEVHSFTRVAIHGPRLTLNQVSINGDILDHWTLEKPAP